MKYSEGRLNGSAAHGQAGRAKAERDNEQAHWPRAVL
jgi:hypothetical protein